MGINARTRRVEGRQGPEESAVSIVNGVAGNIFCDEAGELTVDGADVDVGRGLPPHDV